MTNESPLWFSTQQVAERYGVPVATVRKWRADGTGPAGVRLGRHVRYSADALSAWEREQIAKSVAA